MFFFHFFFVVIGGRTFPARSFPPDGTTFSQISLGQKLTKEIPAYSYWNMQFYQSEPAYVKFDYNIPRGASIGVYARRNALPTHTQYHFKEVLSGFNARTTRATTHVSTHLDCISSFILFFQYFFLFKPLAKQFAPKNHQGCYKSICINGRYLLQKRFTSLLRTFQCGNNFF